ncbi:glutathione S-transferase family protein [Luminiphilus sp.]|nr:glutathione binding-like protein [Luminiphilus sp.]MDA9625462.1 glutathione S-transferase family protein [Luminiphilus sp.]
MYRGNYTLIGQELSMFTRKLEAQLRYQGIPYQWQYKCQENTAAIDARAGTRFIPVLTTPDGWFISDTIALGPLLHGRFHEVPVIPRTAAQRGACFVLEDFFNHWLPRHALHSRWCYPDNVSVIGQKFGLNVLLGKSIDEAPSESEQTQIAGFGQIMRDAFGAAACEVQGAGPDKKKHIQDDLTRMLAILRAHFEQHDFLLGGRACLADFALVGPFKAHFLLDPEPRSWLGEHLVVMEDYVERVWSGALADTDWLANDAIPDTMEPLFEHALNTYQRFAASSLEASVTGEKFFELDLGDGPFTARSMKRLEKARLHVQDELQRCAAEGSPLSATGVMDFYLKPAMFSPPQRTS